MSIKCERLLREEWQKDHEHVHQLEHQALSAALIAANQRLDAMNELRDQINTERARYVPRDTFDTTNSSIDTRLKLLENRGSVMDGKTAIVGSLAALAIAIVLWWLKK